MVVAQESARPRAMGDCAASTAVVLRAGPLLDTWQPVVKVSTSPFGRAPSYGHAGIAPRPVNLPMLLCSPVGAVPVMLAAIMPSEIRASMSARLAVDQLSPAAEAPALVSTRIVRPVRL